MPSVLYKETFLLARNRKLMNLIRGIFKLLLHINIMLDRAGLDLLKAQ